MTRFLAVILLMLAAPPAAGQDPASSGGDPRLQVIPYDAAQVFRLQVAANHQLTIIFTPEERVENVAVGDSEAWQVTLNRRGDALFIKPLRQTGATNMTVITDARIYSFELASAFAASADTPFTVRFVYAEPAPAVPAAQPTPGRYRTRGARALRPAAISDDGVRTYIEWRERQPIPAVFAVDEAGEEILLAGQMRDGRYVIDAVHRTLLFRLERQTARADRLTEGARR